MKRANEGYVSIYLIIITAALVFFSSFLVDLARVEAFRSQAELAVKAGARSVLSSYDPNAFGRYGLFIRGGDSADDLFRETAEGNLGKSADGDFPLLDTEWTDTGVTESRPLANYGIFRKQVMEEMKYKAPINLTVELASRFRGVSSSLQESAQTVDVLERMRQAYDKREKALDEALEAEVDAGEKWITALGQRVPFPAVDTGGSRAAGTVSDAADAALMYDDYVAKRQSDEARAAELAHRHAEQEKDKRGSLGVDLGEHKEDPADDSDLAPQYTAVLAAYESSSASLASSLDSATTKTNEKASADLTKAASALEQARSLNEQMRQISVEAHNVTPAASGDMGVDPDATVDPAVKGSLADIRKTADELVLTDSFFEEWVTELADQSNAFATLRLASESFTSLTAKVAGSVGLGPSLRGALATLQTTYSHSRASYGSQGEIVKVRTQSLEDHRSSDKERKEQEAKAATGWKEASGFLARLAQLRGTKEDREGFQQIKELTSRNQHWNQEEESLPDAGETADSMSDAEGRRDQALTDTGGWLDALRGSLSGTRDSLYYSEYAIGELSRFEPAQVRDALNGKADVSMAINRMETEFVLYGLAEPSANSAAAYGEIFSFRLAIRTMEGLVESRGLGHPLLVLTAALVYGLTNALTDLSKLIETGSVTLSKYIKVNTYYSDYLRLFLLLHGGSGAQLSRMIAVIENELGIDFERAYTYASGEGTASLRLWFMPGLLKLFGKTMNIGGTIRGNRYEASYVADDSYF